MSVVEIDIKAVRAAVNVILDHLIEDLDIQNVKVEENEDFYWNCPAAELYDVSKRPIGLDVGRLSDDVDFVKLVRRGQSGDISYNLVHIFPLLRYISEKTKR